MFADIIFRRLVTGFPVSFLSLGLFVWFVGFLYVRTLHYTSVRCGAYAISPPSEHSYHLLRIPRTNELIGFGLITVLMLSSTGTREMDQMRHIQRERVHLPVPTSTIWLTPVVFRRSSGSS